MIEKWPKSKTGTSKKGGTQVTNKYKELNLIANKENKKQSRIEKGKKEKSWTAVL